MSDRTIILPVNSRTFPLLEPFMYSKSWHFHPYTLLHSLQFPLRTIHSFTSRATIKTAGQQAPMPKQPGQFHLLPHQWRHHRRLKLCFVLPLLSNTPKVPNLHITDHFHPFREPPRPSLIPPSLPSRHKIGSCQVPCATTLSDACSRLPPRTPFTPHRHN